MCLNFSKKIVCFTRNKVVIAAGIQNFCSSQDKRPMTLETLCYKEYLIYDGLGMFGSIGGSLGLFLGFSLFDSLSMLLDVLLKKLNVFQS